MKPILGASAIFYACPVDFRDIIQKYISVSVNSATFSLRASDFDVFLSLISEACRAKMKVTFYQQLQATLVLATFVIIYLPMYI